MWPWGHLAVGYLLVAIWRRSQDDPMDANVALTVAVATQLPDLIDKPLAWWVSVLPTGRSLAHSLPFAFVLVAVGWWLAVRTDRRALGVVFAIGYLSHLAGDALYPVLAGEFEMVTFLAWPLLALPEYDVGQSVGAHLSLLQLGPPFVFEAVLLVAATVVWAADGYPGLGIPSWLRSVLPSVEQ